MIPEPYRSDTLFLLIGENPLPNCIAAPLLLRSRGQVYLVHTQFTEQQAITLKTVLADNFLRSETIATLSLADNHTDARYIYKAIQAPILQMPTERIGALGLNYTGGTKTMAVHAYRAILDLQREATFSYIDPHRLELCIDRLDADSIRFPTKATLTLAQLFQLHGLRWHCDRPPLRHPLLPDVAFTMAALHQQPELAAAWRAWCNDVLRREAQDDRQQWRSESQLATASIPLGSLPLAWQQWFADWFGAVDCLHLHEARRWGFASCKEFCAWLDGIWLEHHVLDRVAAIAPDWAIHDYGMSFRIVDPKQPARAWDKFEFDVAFVRDYQLFALSCTTTASRSMCKQKLFEANQRARQLGGGEARVALVCAYRDPESLRSELEILTRNRKLAVFGCQDWPALDRKIAAWIDSNTKP